MKPLGPGLAEVLRAIDGESRTVKCLKKFAGFKRGSPDIERKLLQLKEKGLVESQSVPNTAPRSRGMSRTCTVWRLTAAGRELRGSLQ